MTDRRVGGRTIFWISGWSIPPEWLLEQALQHLPDWRHEAVSPSPRALAKATSQGAEMLGGFSFGAQLLLESDDPRPRLLLAPFPDLKSESALGGAVATVRIRQQLRQFRRNPADALADFRRLINAPDFFCPTDPSTIGDLAWCLDRMLETAPTPRPLPHGSLALAGSSDPLLDIPSLRMSLPILHVIDAAHEAGPLLAEAARLLQHRTP